MDTKNYLYLLSIERFRSVSRAAKELGITPQGLARAVRRMEEELSCTMYEGALGASDLTEQGKCVLERGQAIVDEERGMRCALDAINAHASNVIRLGCSMGVLGYLGEGALYAFNQSQDCQIYVSDELPDSECERCLAEGKCDYALLINPPDPAFASIPLVNDYQFVWVNRTDGLADAQEVTLADFDGRTVYSVNDDYRNTGYLMKLCADAGVKPTFRFTSEMMRVYECARAGMGLGLTCRNHVEATSESQRTVGLPLRALPWGFSLCYRRDHVPTPAEVKFMDYMRSLRRDYK